MKKLLIKKDEAEFTISMFSYVFGILAIAIMLVFFIGQIGNLDKKDSVVQTVRSYILKMETTGYMDSAMMEECNAKLANFGTLTVDTSNTTTTQAQYGGDIILTITGELNVKKYSLLSIFNLEEDNGTIPLTVRRMSTAKY